MAASNHSTSPGTDFYQKLYDSVMRDPRTSLEHWSTLRLRTLLLMNIIHLRKLLADQVGIMFRNGKTNSTQMDRIGDLMSKYVSALRDLKFLLEKIDKTSKTDTMIDKLRYINAEYDRAILNEAGILSPDPNRDDPIIQLSDYTGDPAGLTGGMINEEKTRVQRAFIERFATALLGGLALIAPMLIMRLKPNLLTQLLTSSLFILAFGCCLAYFLDDSDPKFIATAGAAYAAVLVVFVGSGGSS